MKVSCFVVAALTLGMLLSRAALAEPAEERSLTELRNTVVNLLQALVDRGVITREQADEMVKKAQDKAAAEAGAPQGQRKAEENAVRVPYIPEIVKDEISKQVASELGPDIKKEVVEEATTKGALFAALPEWMRRLTWTGDIRVRGEGDVFAKDNVTNVYLDFNQINSKGGIVKAGELADLNTTENQERLRLRARFGFDADLGSGWTAGLRLATGSVGEIIATTNQTLGTYGAGYQVTIDQGYLAWTGRSSGERQLFTMTAGRFGNPWLSTDLVWYNDLTFEGILASYRLNFVSDSAHRHDLFATLGAFPLQSFSLSDPNASGQQKWLTGAQLGTDLHFAGDSRLKFAAAYYDYIHIVGQENALNTTLLNWTAPAFVQKGNTMFDISNSTDPTVNLFALASNYRIVDLIAAGELRLGTGYMVGLTAEALKNIGFNTAEVMARTGTYVAPRTKGYRADAAFGSGNFGPPGTWRASMGYRYLQRDAVLDAFNDEDFHLGGTDTRGYTLMLDLSINPRVWIRMKYMDANAIDGPPLGIDVWQLDLNGRF